MNPLDDEVNKLLVQREAIAKRMAALEDLLKRSAKYVHSHWYGSGVGMGKDARLLLNEIEKLFPGIEKTY